MMRRESIGHAREAIILLAFLLLLFSACRQDDISSLPEATGSGGASYNIGNDVQFSSGTVLYSPNWLHAWTFSVPNPTNVVGFGVIINSFDTPSGGEMAKMALYEDAAGIPGAFVVDSAVFPIPIGRNEISISPTPIPPGAYWIAIIADALSYVIFDTGPGVAYRANGSGILFANPFPDPFSFAGQSPESPVNVYMKVVN